MAGKARKPILDFRFGPKIEDALHASLEGFTPTTDIISDSDMVLRQEVDKSGGASYHRGIGPMQSQSHAGHIAFA